MSEFFGPQTSPKSSFFTGLFLGVAVCATIGLVIVLGMAMNGKLAIGALAKTASPTVQQPTGNVPTPPSNPEPVAGPVRPVDATDHVLGPTDAKVTVIEYSDFECPFCKRFFPTVKQLLQEYPKDVRFVYRHFPLNSIHPSAQKAAEGTECAAKLGGNDAFWKLHDKIFERAPSITPDVVVSLAKEIGLNEGQFKTCLDSGEMAAKVNKDLQEGSAAGVQGTPATFINGSLISGAVPYETIKAGIEAELKK